VFFFSFSYEFVLVSCDIVPLSDSPAHLSICLAARNERKGDGFGDEGGARASLGDGGRRDELECGQGVKGEGREVNGGKGREGRATRPSRRKERREKEAETKLIQQRVSAQLIITLGRQVTWVT